MIRFLSVVFLRFCFSVKKYALFNPHFYMFLSTLTRLPHTGQKFFVKGYSFILKISLCVVHTQNFYTKFLYVTVYFVRIWAYKNADEKAHTFSRRSEKVKKTDEKQKLCKFTLK